MAPEPETTAKRAELPMRLTRLRVKNFRSIADIDIPLSPLTVLVGPNGSGKSNVVDALRFVRDVFARGLDQAVMDREGMGVIQRWGTEGEGITIGIDLETKLPEVKPNDEISFISDEPNAIYSIGYEFKINSSINFAFVSHELIRIDSKGHPLMIKVEQNKFTIEYRGQAQKNISGKHSFNSPNPLGPARIFEEIEDYTFSNENSIIDSPTENQELWFGLGLASYRLSRELTKLLFYTLNIPDLRQPQQLLKETPFDEEGRNLAAVLRRFINSEISGKGSLLFALRSAVSGFYDLDVEKVGGYLATKLIYQSDTEAPRASYLAQESDGTIRMLGLLAALLQKPSQPFISIEEPEANIHPGALAVLAGVIDEASLCSQILVTTHSPDMLDHLPVESFLVVEKIGDTTHVGPLDASQIASVRKRLFTPGELFRMEGLQRQTEPESAS